MIQIKSKRFRYGLVALGVGAMLVFFDAGCKKSSSRAASEESQQSVVQAGELLRASSKQVVIKPAEIERAAETSPKRVAQQVAKRLQENIDTSAYDASIERLEKLQEEYKQGNHEVLAQISHLLLASSEQLLSAQRQADEPTLQENRKQLAQAEKQLRQAIAAARESGNRPAGVGPELMLGTLKLVVARDGKVALRDQELRTQTILGRVSRLPKSMVREKAWQYSLLSYMPEEVFKVIKARLDEQPHGLRAELARVQEEIGKLRQRQNQAQQEQDFNNSRASEMYAQHLELLLQAEEVEGDKRYELLRRAYEIRSGSGMGLNRVEGGIYYEAQAELAENELIAVTNELGHQVLRQKQLTRAIAQNEQILKELRTSETINRVQAGTSDIQRHRAKLVSDTSVALKEFQAEEAKYVEMRSETVDAFLEAMKAYERAARSARAKSREYAEKMAQKVRQELIELWNGDARHYERAVTFLEFLAEIDELGDAAGQIRRDFQQRAAQAQTSAAQLSADEAD